MPTIEIVYGTKNKNKYELLIQKLLVFGIIVSELNGDIVASIRRIFCEIFDNALNSAFIERYNSLGSEDNPNTYFGIKIDSVDIGERTSFNKIKFKAPKIPEYIASKVREVLYEPRIYYYNSGYSQNSYFILSGCFVENDKYDEDNDEYNEDDLDLLSRNEYTIYSQTYDRIFCGKLIADVYFNCGSSIKQLFEYEYDSEYNVNPDDIVNNIKNIIEKNKLSITISSLPMYIMLEDH